MKTFKRAKQNLSQSALVLLVSTILVKIIGACFKIPLATNNFLGDLGFGYFSVAYDLFVPFYTLAISGLTSALSHIIAEFLAQKRFKDIKKTFKLTKRLFIILGILFSAIFSIFAIPFVKFTDTSGNTLYSIYAVIPSIFLCFIISVYRGYFEGFSNMNPTAVSKIIEAVGKLVLGLGFAFVTIRLTSNPAYSAGAAMLGITSGTFISAGYLHCKYKLSGNLITENELLQSPSSLTNNKTVKVILCLALPMAFSSLFSSAVSVIDAVSVRSLLQDNVTDLFVIYEKAIQSYNLYSGIPLEMANLPTYLYGLRSKAFTLFNLIPTLTMSFGVGAIPALSYYWSKKDINKVKENLNTVIKLISLITLPASMAYITVSKPIMQLLYSDYGSVNIGGNILLIYGFTAIFAGFAIPLTSVLQSLDCQFTALFNILIGAFIKIILNIVFVSNTKLNIYGSAISTAICYLFILIAHIYKIFRTVGKIKDVKTIFLKPLLAALCSSLAAYLMCLFDDSKIVIICAVIVAVIAYIVVVLSIGIISEEDFSNFPKGKKLYFLAKKMKFIK